MRFSRRYLPASMLLLLLLSLLPPTGCWSWNLGVGASNSAEKERARTANRNSFFGSIDSDGSDHVDMQELMEVSGVGGRHRVSVSAAVSFPPSFSAVRFRSLLFSSNATPHQYIRSIGSTQFDEAHEILTAAKLSE